MMDPNGVKENEGLGSLLKLLLIEINKIEIIVLLPPPPFNLEC